MPLLKYLIPFIISVLAVQACIAPGISKSDAASTSSAETAVAELTQATLTFTFTPTSTFTPTPSPTFTPSPTATEVVLNIDEYTDLIFEQIQHDPQICSDIIIWEYVKDFATIPEGYTVTLMSFRKGYQVGWGPPLCKMFLVSPSSPGTGQALYVRKNYNPVTKDPALVVVDVVYFDQRYIDDTNYFGLDNQTPTPYGD
jgi:hypothetical protein